MESTLVKRESMPSGRVQIFLPDNQVLSAPRGTSIGEILSVLDGWQGAPIMGAIINGELRELTYAIEIDARVTPITMSDEDGARIYRRSITFLLEAAFEELYPDETLTVDHSVASGGYFCQLTGGRVLTELELDAVEDRMQAFVNADLPFERRQVPLAEAIAIFEQNGQSDKVRLLKYRQKGHLVLYRLGTHQDYHHGYMVPRTGLLRWFELTALGQGFVLRYPRRVSPTKILPMPSYPKLLTSFRQYGDWLVRLGIDSVGALNDSITDERIREIILVSEALHEHQISEIAEKVADRAKDCRIVLIAGPSSSGKTTFSKRLAVQLLVHGISPYPVELDNYFVDREETPKDSAGQYDFESLGALKTDLLANHLQRLTAGEEVQLPRYDFKAGKSVPGEVARLQPGQILILEGIHGLNPKLLPTIDPHSTFKVYVSCLTQLNLDRHNRISTTDSRLIRRIVRDARERGYTAQDTIHRWESVRIGEKHHIFPFQENADEMFNSATVYELAALKGYAEPLLRQTPYGTLEHIEAKRLLAFLEWFLPINTDLIPDNSLVREFIGGSILKDFKIWHNGS